MRLEGPVWFIPVHRCLHHADVYESRLQHDYIISWVPVPVLSNVIISGGASLLHQKGPSFSAKPRCLLRLVLTVLGRKSDQLVVRHISATCDTRGFNALAETWKRSWYVMMTYYDYSIITAETCWNHPRKNMIDYYDRLNHIEPWIKNSTPNTLIQSCLKLWLGWRRSRCWLRTIKLILIKASGHCTT